MSSSAQAQAASRFDFSERAEPFRLRSADPHVHGYAWRHPDPVASLVLIHGFQSHAQWFAEAGDLLLRRGLSVYAVERRGSGSSPYEVGHVRRYQDWFEEVADVARLAREERPQAPVHLVGHCFGADIALGCVLTQPVQVSSIAMLTPGLYLQQDYTLGEKLGVLFSSLRNSRRRFRAPQEAEHFSRDPDLVAWIRTDSLGAQTATGRCFLETGRLLRYVRRNLAQVTLPVLVLEAGRDRISDNSRNRAALESALGNRCRFVTFDAEHFLVSEPCRDEVLDELTRWVSNGRVQ